MNPWIILGPAGALAGLEVSPALIVVGFVLLALALSPKTWLEPTIAGMSTRKAGAIARILDIPGRLIRGAAASVFSRVTHAISVGATHRMAPLARWLYGLGSLAIGAGWALRHFAADTAYAIDRLATVVLPREIRRATLPIRKTAGRALAGALAAGLAVKHLRRYLDRLYTHQIRPALHHLNRAVTVTIPRELGRVGFRLRDLERSLAHPSPRWLRRIAAGMWVAFLAGAFARALARRFPWLFCRKVKNVGGRICGLDQGLLDSLLMDTLLITGTVSVVAFAEELQAIEREAVGLISGFIDEL